MLEALSLTVRRGAAQRLREPLGRGHDRGGVHPTRGAGEPLERAGDRDRGDDLAAGGADGRRDRRHALLALADRLRPTTTADAGEGGGGVGGVLQPAVHALGVLPGQQHLGGRPGAHRQLGADGDGVAQPGGALGGRHAHAVVALAAPELGGLAGDVAQPGEHGAGGGEEAVLAGGCRELGEPRAEDEAALHVAGDEAVVLERHRETVCRGSGQARRADQARQGRRARLQGRQHDRRLVENAHSTAVHMAILMSRGMGWQAL